MSKEFLALPANGDERTRVLAKLAEGKDAEYMVNGEVYRLVPRRPHGVPDEPTPEALVEIGNKRVLEIVGVWVMLSQFDQYAWIRDNGWHPATTNGYWDHDNLGSFRTKDGVFKIELQRALLNPRSLL